MDGFTYRGADGPPLYAATVGESGRRAPRDGGHVVVLLHGGGPDHHSLIPLAQRVAHPHVVVLPDVRGYGRSVCPDESLHTWAQYADDVIALLDHLQVRDAFVGGVGLGATIALRTAVTYPDRVAGAVLISVEDIEDDERKQAEVAFMDAFAARVRNDGIEAGWGPILGDLAPVIGTMVRDAIPRSDPASIAAAAAIGRDRAFRTVGELSVIESPVLVFPGLDWRHPAAVAEELARVLPNGRLSPAALSAEVLSADDFAKAFSPAIRDFLASTPRGG